MKMASNTSRRFNNSHQFIRWLLIAACSLFSALVVHSMLQFNTTASQPHVYKSLRALQPSVASSSVKKHDPAKWLMAHSDLNHHETGKEWFNDRPNAAIISLVRNEELDGILQSMRQLERHWNERYNYPWVFFSEKEFTEEFKVIVLCFAQYLSSNDDRLQHPMRHQHRHLTISYL